MPEPFSFWVFLALLSGTAAVVWLLTGRAARHDDDLEADERVVEAAWISESIERWGGDVPQPVVEQVLELHRRYLEGVPPAPADARSAGDDPAMQGHDAGRESPEADAHQPR